MYHFTDGYTQLGSKVDSEHFKEKKKTSAPKSPTTKGTYTLYQRVGRFSMYVGMAPICPLSLNKYNSSELSNAAAIWPFRHITWPTSVSTHNNTLKGGQIHCYNDIREIAKTPISPSSSSSKRPSTQVFTLILVPSGFKFRWAVL